MNTNQTLEALMAQLFSHARMRLANAIKGYWFHESRRCPGCTRPVNTGEQGRWQTVSLLVVDKRQHTRYGAHAPATLMTSAMSM